MTGHFDIRVEMDGYTSYNHYYPNSSEPGPYPYSEIGDWATGDWVGYLPVGIDDGERVEIDASGTANVVVEWVDGSGHRGSASTGAPERVTLVVSSTASVSAPAGCLNSSTLENGFDDEIVQEPENTHTYSRWQSGKHLKTLRVDGGVTRFSLNLRAQITSPCPAFPSGTYDTRGFIGAFPGVGVAFDNRDIGLTINGRSTTMKRVPSGQKTYTYVRLGPKPGKVDGDTPTVTQTYEDAHGEASTLSYQGIASNSMNWHLGLPFTVQQYILREGGGIRLEPDPVPPVGFSLQGYATSPQNGAYGYKGKGTTAGMYFVDPNGSIGGDSVSYDGPIFQNLRDTDYQGLGARIIKRDDENTDEIAFKFEWPDGVIGEANRTALFHPGVEKMTALAPFFDDQDPYQWVFIPMADGSSWQPESNDNATVREDSSPLYFQYAGHVVTLIGAGIAATSPAAVEVGIVAAVMNIGISAGTPSANNLLMSRVTGKYVSEENEEINVQQNQLANWQWRLQADPGERVYPWVTDLWNDGGFAGRTIVIEKERQRVTECDRRTMLRIPPQGQGGAGGA